MTDATARPECLRPHRRRNPLTGRHVLVSPQRALRPWQGEKEPPVTAAAPAHDPDCYLCAGNMRAGGVRNPDYPGVYIFDNDFPALLNAGGEAENATQKAQNADPLFANQPVAGVSRVICFSPDHSATLPDLSAEAMRGVVDAWCAETETLGRTWRWVQLFENKGAMMGCSNPHPHGQAWATDVLPDEAAAEDAHQRAWFGEHGEPMLMHVARSEMASGERVVVSNADWVAIVPFWASWPFETLLMPRFVQPSLTGLSAAARGSLGDIVQRLTRAYDALFGVSFPYSMGWHGAPSDGSDTAAWQVHAHFYPPLLRSASVRKFMVGYEMLAEAQRDLTPEQAAERLRAVAS